MKLKRSRMMPEESTIRFVVDDRDRLIGGIGTAGDLVEAKIISVSRNPMCYVPSRWVAIKMSTGDMHVFDTREEALSALGAAQGRATLL